MTPINKKILILPIILIISLIFSYYFGEDTLGGAKHDYLQQVKFILLFSENFFDTFKNFGIGELIMSYRTDMLVFLISYKESPNQKSHGTHTHSSKIGLQPNIF